MAAAALAIGLPLLEPLLSNLIAALVHRHAPVIEAQYGPGTGPVKLPDLFAAVIGDLTKAAVAGTIPKALPSDDTVRIIIQAVVSSMKLSGLLDAPAGVAVAPQAVTLRAGQSLTITVA